MGDYRFDLYFYDCPGICVEIIGLTFISTTVQVYVRDYRFDLYFYDCPGICGRFSVLPLFGEIPGICGRLSVLPLFLRLSRYMWEIIGLTFISTTVQVYVGDYRFDLYFYDCPGICGRLSV